MKNLIFFVILIILLIAPCLFADTTFVSGTIIGQTWTTTGSPYCVTGDILVAGLTINPGVEVLFLGNYEFEVAGVLTAVGTTQDSIKFTKVNTSSGWQGIYFNTCPPGSEIAYCCIKYSINSAIRINNSSPLISHCHFDHNSAVRGGGINAAEISISECIFTNNTATGSGSSRGGGIYSTSSASITKCIFKQNRVSSSSTNSSGLGGGIYLNGTSNINNCVFKENSSYATSGGIYATSTSRGGGIYISGNSTITNCILSENSSTESHGGLGSAGSRGGSGFCMGSGTVNLINVTVAHNNYQGVRIDGGSLSIMNSIIWFNISSEIYGAATVTYSNIEGGFTGMGNIGYNPIFYNAPTCLNVVPPSPCIDSGNPDSLYNDPEDPDSTGYAIWPSLGNLRNDMGVYGGPGSSSFGIDISCVISPPVVINSIPDTSIMEDSGPQTIIVDLNTVFFDPELGDILSFNSGSNNSDIQTTIQNNSLNINSSQDYFGNGTIIVIATDQNSLSVSDTFLIEILPVNDAPVLNNLQDIIFFDDNTYCLDLDTTVVDVDDSTENLSWTVDFVDTLSGIIDSVQIQLDSITHLVCFIPLPNFIVEYQPLLFVVTDTTGATDHDTILMSIIPENDPPVISQLPDTSFFEDDSLIYPISRWFPFVHDPDNPDGELSYFVLPGNHVTADPGNAIFILHSPENWFGADTLKLIVSDSLLSDTANFYINVLPINDPPSISGLPSLISFPANLSDTLIIWDYVEDIESPDSILTYQFAKNNDSLYTNYHQSNGELILTANIIFAGDVKLYITVIDDSNATATDSLVISVAPATGIEDPLFSGIPKTYVLFQNYPNPFNPNTQIRFGLPKASQVKIDVYNMLGQKVAELLNENKQAGYHRVEFYGSDFSSGVYFYKIQAENFVETKKMILLR